MLEYSARITSQDDLAVDLDDLRESLGYKASTVELEDSVSNMLRVANKIQAQLCGMSVCDISDSGYVEIKRQGSCPVYSGGLGGDFSIDTPVEYQKEQVRLTLRSDYDALKRQVDSLSARIAQLEATTRITPVTNCDLRKRGSTLYPRYGDWLLTSDASTQYLSFSGLRAEVGRSIYIQTRKKVYFYCNNQSFYGLPGSSTRENQWLSNNTTYRFVRASSDSWLVTSSSSPYPWT